MAAAEINNTTPLPITQATTLAGEDLTNDVHKVEQRYLMSYQAAAGANKVIKSGAGFLHAIIVGKDVAGGIIEVSDHATDGDGNVKIYLEDAPPATYLVNASFSAGIAVDMTTQTNVTFIYR